MGLLEQLEIDHEGDLVDKFLVFFRTLCDKFEPLVAQLELSEIKYKESLEELIRLTHNVSWACNEMQIDEVKDFCVFFEEILEQAKKLKGPASHEFVEWLWLVGDQFEKYCSCFETNSSVLAVFNPNLVSMPNTFSK